MPNTQSDIKSSTKSNMNLGRGLAGLISEESANNQNEAYIPNLPIEFIIPNSYQPRMVLDETALNQLAASIKENGIIEPLLVTKRSNESYELIAGERRWRAAIIAEFETVPVVVKNVSSQEMLELAIIENIQREDLNPLEEAAAFNNLKNEFNLTPLVIAKRLGLSESVVKNRIRLLALQDEIRKGLLEEVITEGHAKALLGLINLDTQLLAYHRVIKQHLSVRATEELTRRLKLGVQPIKMKNSIILDGKSSKYEKDLRNFFNNDRIKLSRSNVGGKIEMRFKSDEELDQIFYKMGIL